MGAVLLGACVVAFVRMAMLSKRIELLEKQLVERKWGFGRPTLPAPEAVAVSAAVPAPAAAAAAAPAAAPAPVAAAVAVAAPAPGPDPEPATDWWRAFELRAGTRWITWIGAAALVIGAALFIKLAVDEGWLGPTARFALSAGAGAVLVVMGLRAQRATMRPLAQGLFGAGLGVLYVSTYVAFASHGIIPREIAFAAMVGVTVLGCGLALRYDAEPVAVLALLGGLVTPVAVSTGDASRDALFTYLLTLDLGVLGIAAARRWLGLERIAFIGTWVLFGGFLERYHDPAAWRIELAWLGAFHAVFLVLPFVYHFRRRIALAPGRLGTAVLCGGIATALAAWIVDGERDVLGAVALVMAAGYQAIGMIARRRIPGDGRARYGFTALAVVYATLAVPLLARDHGIALAWAIEAPVLLALGFVYRDFVTRLAGLGVLALAIAYLVGAHWPDHAAGFVPFANVDFGAGAAVAAAAGLFAIVHRALAARCADARDRWMGVASAVAGAVLGLVLVHNEIDQLYTLAQRPEMARALLPLVWVAGALGALAVRRDAIGLVAASAAAVVAAGQILLAYQFAGEIDAHFVLNVRFGSALAVVGVIAVVASLVRRRDHEYGAWLWGAALVVLGGVIGAEAYLHQSDGHRAQSALSIVWAAYAGFLLAIGFARRSRALRLGGLALLGAIALKLVLVDLAGAAPLHRVLSFLGVGVLMIGASYAYHRLERR